MCNPLSGSSRCIHCNISRYTHIIMYSMHCTTLPTCLVLLPATQGTGLCACRQLGVLGEVCWVNIWILNVAGIVIAIWLFLYRANSRSR